MQTKKPAKIKPVEIHFTFKGIPKKVLKVIKRIKKEGYSAYFVGGCIRDLLLGIQPKDFDIGTDATLEEVLEIFPKRSQIIGKRFPIVHVYFDRSKKDFVEVTSFASPFEDAFRRDLTINALFYDPEEEKIIDYTGGLEDLKKGIIKVIGDPEERFKEDPVRMLRTVRHSARLGFHIEQTTWKAILECRSLIKTVVWVRLRDEILKDIAGYWIKDWFNLMKHSGLLFEIYPFLRKKKKWDEKVLLKVLELLEKDNELSLSARIALFLYPFLPFIEKPYDPLKFRKVPGIDRKEMLRLFWMFFFTFKFNKELFERAMSILRDSYKIVYLLKRKHKISRRYRNREHFQESLKIAHHLLKLL